jgi:class 3 adenylate cyclase/tetratricopeptide (TPR) repeat protein
MTGLMKVTHAPPDPPDLGALRRLWEDRDLGAVRATPGQYLEYAEIATGLSHHAFAYDILVEARGAFPEDASIAHRLALSATDLGNLSRASRILDDVIPGLSKSDPLHSEALSLRGRIAKERWARTSDSAEAQSALEDALAFYRQAFDASRNFYPGINAASMALLAGRQREAQDLAREVLFVCLEARSAEREGDLWYYATMGEAHLLLGERREAAQCYSTAAQIAGADLGYVARMRRQVLRLTHVMHVDESVLGALDVGRVIVFVGHMIDEIGRAPPRFPPEIEDAVRVAIEVALSSLDARIGFSSLACGSDIIFCEAMQARSAETNVILPFAEVDFLDSSVSFAGESWVKRFQAAKRGRNTTIRDAVADAGTREDVLFTYCQRILEGAAVLRAQELATDVLMLAVLDPTSEPVRGGTQKALQEWESLGRQSHVIDLQGCRKRGRARSGPRPGTSWPQRRMLERDHSHRRATFTSLFADMVGFGRLRDSEFPAFFEHYLRKVSWVLQECEVQPAFFNTWGDGIFLVFGDPGDAADFALRLRDEVTQTDWSRLGLSRDTNIRVALHTGPIFQAWDPVLERENFFGQHVTRAARLEPVTGSGSVFVTEETASFLSATPLSRFACDYLGEILLPKESKAQRVYRLRRAKDAE